MEGRTCQTRDLQTRASVGPGVRCECESKCACTSAVGEWLMMEAGARGGKYE